MRKVKVPLLALSVLSLASCSSFHSNTTGRYPGYSGYSYYSEAEYASRIPESIDTHGEKVVLIDPNVHVWGAYGTDGKLVKAGIATAGGEWCDDINEPCKTAVGSYRIQRLGDGECVSKQFPLPNGGGLMPYCMFFSGGQALHGSPDGTVVEANISHGCVRMRIADAEWLRYNFASVGTKVVVQPY